MRSLVALALLLASTTPAQAFVRESSPLRESAFVRSASTVREARPVREMPADVPPTFDFNPYSRGSGPVNLEASLTINGATVAPHLLYVGTDASTGTWTARIDEDGDGALTNDAGGADPVVGASTPFLDANTSVEFGGGDGYAASATTVGTIDTEDFSFELIVQGTSGTQTIWSRYSNATSSWGIYQSGTSGWVLAIQNGASPLNFSCTHTIVDRAWYHLAVFVNRDENSANGVNWYVNGVSCGTGNASTLSGSLTGLTYLMTLGDQPAGTGNTPFTRRILWAAMWKRANWFQAGAASPTEWASVVAARLPRPMGTRPVIARGSATPTTTSRSSPATLHICTGGVMSYHVVGAGWPRVGRDCSSNVGYRVEQSATNTFLQSRTIGTTWAKCNAGDTAGGGSVATPFGITSTTAGLIGQAVNVDHCVTQGATVSAATWTHSTLAKAGTHSWAYLSDNTVANATAYFNLSTCAAGTKGAGAIQAFTESLGNGWCLIGISFTGTAAAHTFQMSAADADGDKTTTGNGASVMVYFTEMQLEALPLPTSRIQTTTGTVTRSADQLDFSGTSNVNAVRGSMICSVIAPNYASTGFTYVIGASDGTSNNYVALLSRNLDLPRVTMIRAAGTEANIDGTTDINAGVLRTVATTWQTNDVQLFVSGASEGTPDTSATMAASYSAISIGSLNGTLQWNGDVVRCRIFDAAGRRQ